MDQLGFMNEKVVIINKITTLLSNISYDKNNKLKMLLDLLLLVPKILSILTIKYATENVDKVYGVSVKLLTTLFYSKTEYFINGSSSVGSKLDRMMFKIPKTELNNILFRMEKDAHVIRLYNMRLLPYSKNYNKLFSEIHNSDAILHSQCVKFVRNDKTQLSESIIPNKMFPSKNFKMLAKVINRSIELAERLGYYQTIPILINGEPGLGKTKSLDYLAYNSTLGNIRKVDLTSYINSDIPLQKILTFIIVNITSHTAIFIDELDKYISSKCQFIEDPEKACEEMLNDILSLVELDSTGKYSVFIIFCSNNFDTIFEHISIENKLHYASFKDRFFQLQFNRVDKDEFCEYIKWLDDTKDVDNLLELIPDDFNITFHKLYQCVTAYFGDVEEICKNIKSSEQISIPTKVKSQRIAKQSPKSTPKEVPIEPPQNIPIVQLDPFYEKGKLEFGDNPFDANTWTAYYSNNLWNILDPNFFMFVSKTVDMGVAQNILGAISVMDKEFLPVIECLLSRYPLLIDDYVAAYINMLYFKNKSSVDSIFSNISEPIVHILKTYKNNMVYSLVNNHSSRLPFHSDKTAAEQYSIFTSQLNNMLPDEKEFINKLSIDGEQLLFEWVIDSMNLFNSIYKNSSNVYDTVGLYKKHPYANIHSVPLPSNDALHNAFNEYKQF